MWSIGSNTAQLAEISCIRSRTVKGNRSSDAAIKESNAQVTKLILQVYDMLTDKVEIEQKNRGPRAHCFCNSYSVKERNCVYTVFVVFNAVNGELLNALFL
ncbi:hypothetical protein EEL30_00525 (plasmid) [Brevibacillus laterosporus]|uniref:Uncharacterized protein n=1 Tax=Brevibacillus laterosporus TaxID=1465 RepID=A0A518V1X2_BRELA|nr:hypothetical protein EEL30_00525 [Brevibacillus laterosporus]